MAVKHLTRTMDHDIKSDPAVKYKAKPKVYDDTWLREYWLERDRCLWKIADEETKEQIKIRYGIV